jgi:alpha-L-fucosidase
VIYPLGRTFSYETDADKHKGTKWIVYNIIDCAAKGGNFMIGVGPDGNGKFHPTAIEQMKQAGNWLKTNGESIYATRARAGELWKEVDNVRFTQSKDQKTVFAHVFELPNQQVQFKTVKPKAKSKIFLLGYQKPLAWKYSTEKGLIISLPDEIKKVIPVENQVAFSFKIIQ